MDRLVLSHAALPHMMATLVEDTITHSLQLLTSGTSDLVRLKADSAVNYFLSSQSSSLTRILNYCRYLTTVPATGMVLILRI